jgi:hypothetical protein
MQKRGEAALTELITKGGSSTVSGSRSIHSRELSLCRRRRPQCDSDSTV